MNDQIPKSARVVVIGGGIAGASVAYHLVRDGWKDTVLLEQNQLAGGTTWHAAGMVGRLRTSNNMTWINRYSAELYAGLKAETGHDVGWKQVGSLIVATNAERMIQLKRTICMSKLFGVEAHMISPREAAEKWPLMRHEDLLGAAWLPHDGKVIPKEVVQALAIGIRNRGGRVCEGVHVTGVQTERGRVVAVETEQGTIQCEHAVITGGMWSRQFGAKLGISIPLYPVEHHYVVSREIPGAFDELPLGRDPDSTIYFRGEGKGIVLGAFQAYTKPWLVPEVPRDFSFKLLEDDWVKYRKPLEAGNWRIPALESAGYEKFVNGPESFTPDNNFLMGEIPGWRGLFVAAGFNSAGIATAGGAGLLAAKWIMEGEAPMDLWSVDIRRFGPEFNNVHFLRDRVTEVLGLHYQMAWPNREFETGRDLKRSPVHGRLATAGACFGVKNGWERPNWFAEPGQSPVTEYSFGKQNWFENHRREHMATRESVALFDQSGFSKIDVQGRDALGFLQRVCANNVDVRPGNAVYTGMLNSRGGFESDLTVIRLAEDRFYLVTGSAQTVRDIDWLQRSRGDGENVHITDVTGAYSVLSIMGPESRNVIGRLSESDLSQAAFPFGAARSIALGAATALAVRITYVGELGWELHVKSEQAGLLYDLLMDAGKNHGIRNAGHYAINSLRLEKGYRAWGAELSPDDTPLEAGLGFAVAWDKQPEFIGKQVLITQKGQKLRKRLAIFVLEDPEAMLWGNEPIFRNGEAVGYTTSGSYGFAVGGAIGMGYLKHPDAADRSAVLQARYELETNGYRVPAQIHLRAPYDPDRIRILVP